MQQRRPRLGDILDDYCPRERRITNHAVVAMIEDQVHALGNAQFRSRTRLIHAVQEIHPRPGGIHDYLGRNFMFFLRQLILNPHPDDFLVDIKESRHLQVIERPRATFDRRF